MWGKSTDEDFLEFTAEFSQVTTKEQLNELIQDFKALEISSWTHNGFNDEEAHSYSREIKFLEQKLREL